MANSKSKQKREKMKRKQKHKARMDRKKELIKGARAKKKSA